MIFLYDGLVTEVLKAGQRRSLVNHTEGFVCLFCMVFQGQVEYQPKEKGNPGRKKMKTIENFLRRSINFMVRE